MIRQLSTALLLMFVLTAKAQGPGGISSDLQIWLKANAGTEVSSGVQAVDGETIRFWRDQSSNGYDGRQDTGSERPTLNYTNNINGNPVLDFDGTNDHFPINALNYPSTTFPSSITIYAILRTTNAGEGVVLSFDRNEYFRFAGDHNNNGGFGLSTTNSSGTTDDFNANGTLEDDGIPHILGGSIDPAISGTNKFLYFDGEVNTSTDAGTTSLGTGTNRFGFIGTGSEATSFDGTQGPTNYLEGDLAEIIYYGTALNTTQRQQVESYLAIKYGITLGSDTDGNTIAFEAGEGDYLAADGTTVVWDASANSTYHNDVAGIAEDMDAELSQATSKSIGSTSIFSVTDNSLAENDYILWGHNNAGLSASPSSGSNFSLQFDRVWKVEITGSTNNVDLLEIDLSLATFLPAGSELGLLIDDNESFTSPIELNGTLVGQTLTFNNVDLSSFAGDIYITGAFTPPSPGGVGNDLTLWYKADAGVEEALFDIAEEGDRVRFWRDQSGNGHDGQQSDSGERPTYASNTLNFNPTLAFDGSAHLPIVDLNYDLTTNTLEDFTIYSVIESSQSDEGIIVSFDRSSFFRFALNHTNNANFGLSTTVDNTLFDSNASNNASDGQAHLIGADYSVASDDQNLYFDGGVETLNSIHSPVASSLGNTGEVPRFGYIAANSEADTFDGSDNGSGITGNVAEIIYFEGILSATDRAKVESYLSVKYGLTLSGDYVASDGSTVIWDNSANTGYNNMIGAIGVDNTATLSQTQSKSENASAILTISDGGLSDGNYFFWGNDGADLSVVTSGSGSRDGRFNRIWKVQVTGSTGLIDQLDFDLSSVVINPTAIGNYRLLVDDNAAFSSPNEIVATSFTSDILRFTNVDFTGEVFMAIGLDPDLDNDGIADLDDIDDDNDGLLDIDEGNGMTDTDADGIVDSRDLDSDNDGIGDLYESGAEADADVSTIAAILDTNNDGTIDLSVSLGTNGYADILETAVDNGTRSFTISDSDASAPSDFRDLDTDNNGISDLVESGRSTSIDSDDDGLFEGVDLDEDGVADEVDSDDLVFGSVLDAIDRNLDGEPDFRDLDNDGDGIDDVDEVSLTDTTPADGRLDGSTDEDGDGVLSGRDDDDNVFGQINLASLLSGSGVDWYSFRSGDWDDPDNWTLDPSGSVRVNPGGLYPNNFVDNVFVLNGDEMNVNFNGLVLSSLTIENGGIVDIGMTTNHNFNTISGEGSIEISTDEFPGGTATDFISSSGGTVIYTDQSPAVDYELTTPRVFNNMIINSAANNIVLKADYSLNGDLTVASGTFQINDNTSDAFVDNTTPLNLLVNGSLTVDATGVIKVGDVDASSEIGTSGIFTFHQLEILGDFTNNGSVSFTNLNSTSIADGRYRDKYPTASDEDNLVAPIISVAEYGAVEALFTSGSSDQLITMNGPTDFYRIEVAKGTSQTFTATFNASAAANFRLLGRIAMDQSDDSGNTPNIDNHRALGLEAGILKLGDNIVINEIAKEDDNGSDPSTQGGNRNYIIDLDAQLWLSSNAVVTKNNPWGIHPFGKLKVSDNATLTFTGTGQRTILVDNQGVFEMTGGTVDITQYRNKTGADGAPRGSFIMTGGVLNVGQGSVDGNHGVFSVPWQDQNFILNASDLANPPVINITLDGNRGKDNAAIQIGVRDGNYDVGESEINVIHTSNTDYKIASTVPFYSLSYDNSGTGELIFSDIIDADDYAPSDASATLPDDNSGTIPSPAQFAQPLEITNDLTISDGRLNANDQNLTVGNLFTIISGGEYNPGMNTTLFNGSSPIQQIRLNGATPLVGGGFYNLSFSTSGTTKEFGGDLAAVLVLGDLTIGSGVTLDDDGKVIQVNGDLSNSGNHITDFASPGRIEITGGSTSHEIGGDGTGQFKILNIDDATNAVSFTADQQIDSLLNLVNGILDIDVHQLTINSSATDPVRDDLGGTGNFGTTRYIRTAGNASDEGISIFIDNDRDNYFYPMGTDNESGMDKYTPATLSILGSSVINSGFIKINVADAVLPTIESSEIDKLSYYWRLNHSGFTTDPSISLRFNYDDEDITGNENQYNGGYVLDEAPFTRVEENANDDDRDINELVFNGSSSNNGAFPGNRFSIINANFSAAGSNAWNGSPEIYYSRATDGSWWEWQDTQHWSTDPINQHLGAAASDYPQDGDIAVVGSVYVDALGCDPCTDSGTGRHQIRIDNTVGNITIAELVFDSQPGGTALIVTDMSRVRIRGGFTLDAGRISGTGELVQDVGTVAETGTILGDLGDFIEEKNNGFFYWFQSETDVTITDRFDFPIFRSFGADGTLDFSQDVTAFGIVVDNGTTMSVSTNWTIDSLIQVGSNGSGTIEFPNLGTNVTLECGTLVYSNDVGNNISVENTGSDTHRLIVNSDINLDAGAGFDLTSVSGVQVELEVTGTGDHSFINTTGVDASLYRLVMNKGVDQTSTFTFNNNFTLSATASGVVKPIEMQNGSLILNDPSLDLDVNSGGGDFTIPATAGLELRNGTIRITASGTATGNGIRLDGKLKVNGGDIVLDGGAGADNYIEYGTGGNSEIEVNSGNLVVGSQLRRNVLSDDGVINYTQSGGTAVFGVTSAPDNSRGVFEIINTGVAGSSSFNLSGAATTFAIVNAQSNPETGTFIIGPSVATTVTADPFIDFGFNGVVAGVTVQNGASQTYEINSSVALPNIRIDNANFNSPTVEMVIQPLTVSTNLQILNGGSLVSNNFDLTINNGFINNGTYGAGTNTTTFNGAVQTIQGTTATAFNNLVINPTTSVTLGNQISVNGNLNILTGLLDDGGNQINLLGDLNISTSHVSNGAGGISLQGASAQDINVPSGAAEIDYLIIENSSGVTLRDNVGAAVTLTIDDELALNSGILSIGDNRLLLDADASVTTTGTFSDARMISVNGVKKSDGVEKAFLASFDAPSFEIPIGTPDKYTPVILDVDGSDDAGSILVKPINAIHPSATGSDALNYYWLVTTNPSTVSNFTGSISFQYLESDANNPGQNEASWANRAARLIAPNWFKPSGPLVDITSNTMTFTNSDLSSFGGTTFDGEYTIGVDIPDQLAQYRSISDEDWNTASNWEIDIDGDGFDDGNGVPQPGTIVIVSAGDIVTMNAATDNDQNIFSLQIDGILDVSNSDGHNFGEVSGLGTLRIGNSTLPGGDYDNFFTTTAGALDLSGAGSYTISPDFASGVRGLTISGGGTKTLPAIALNIGADGIVINDGAILNNAINNNTALVQGDVTINNGTFLLGNNAAALTTQNIIVNAGTFTATGASMDVLGNLSMVGGTFNAGNGVLSLDGNLSISPGATFNNDNGTVTFDGAGDQTITGDFSADVFNNVQLSKASGLLSLASNASVHISNILNLNGGNINTQASGASLRLLNGVGSIVRTDGFIAGPLQVDLNDNDVFSFPVGKGNTFKAVEIDIQNGSQTVNPLTWEVEYYLGSAVAFSSAENSGIDLAAIETNADADEQVINVNPSEYWRIDTGSESAVVENITLDISNIGLSISNINDQQLQVMVWDNAGGEWDHLGGVSSGTPDAANVVSTSTQSFSEHIFTSGVEQDIVLPVELLQFDGVAERNEVYLEWSTATELNNDYFEVQRSRDGYQFESIGIVDGNGTTDEVSYYNFIDRNPGLGDNFYRLRQVDFDGSDEHHKTINVVNDFYQSGIEASIYPNPANVANLNIRISSGDDFNPIKVRVMDLIGNIRHEEIINASLSIDKRIELTGNLPSGLYFVTVEQGMNLSKLKLIIR